MCPTDLLLVPQIFTGSPNFSIISVCWLVNPGSNLILWHTYLLTFLYWFIYIIFFLLARAVGVPAVGVQAVDCLQWRIGHYFHPYWRERAAFQRSAFGRLTAGNDVVATIIISLFFFSFFSRFRRSDRIKKAILQKLLRMPKNPGVDTFPDSVGHFGPPWRSFWILQGSRNSIFDIFQ